MIDEVTMRVAAVCGLLLLAPVLSVCQTVTLPPSTASSKDSATVGGQVFRLDTGEPLKKAQISLQSHSGDAFSAFRLTDEQGHFLVENVPPGHYDLQVSRNGFVDAEYGQKKIGAPGAILTLSAGQHISDLVFKLARAASISGHVFDEDGEPIAHAEVIAYRAAHQSGREERTSDQPISTNDLGEFRIFDLPPGRYFVAVNYRIGSTEERERFNPGYLPTYYPNTTDAAKAAAITVNPGDEIRSIDFMMRPGHLATVSGRVINTVLGASPTGSGSVNLYPRSAGLSGAAQDLYSLFPFKDGHFSIANVPPGSYYLQADWFDRDTKEHHRARRALDVGSADIDGIALTITRGTDIPGRIIWEGSPSADPLDLFVLLRPIEEGELGSPPPAVKSDGSFVFKSVPEGSYRPIVTTRGPGANFFLKAARYGTASLSDSGFAVPSGADISLELTLSSRAAQLYGVVLNSDSLPASGAKVVLIPDPTRREVKERYKFATTDQNGKFSIQGITPGEYKLFCWDFVAVSEWSDGDWFDPTWLKPFEPKGETIHLEESDNKSVSLTLIDSKPDSSTAN
jgi:hypothetical protein